MAEHLNPADPEGGRALSDRSLQLAAAALYEIDTVATVLRRYIDEKDAAGEIQALARGSLARISLLSDALSEVMGDSDDWDDATLNRIILEGGSNRG